VEFPPFGGLRPALNRARLRTAVPAAAEMAIATRAVEEFFDVGDDILKGELSTPIHVPPDPLLLQAAEEELRDRMVPAVSVATHARNQMPLPERPCQSSLLYWVLRSEWVSIPRGRRRWMTARTAIWTSSLCTMSSADHPSMLRE